LSFLGDGFVYVGSTFGDCQLIELLEEKTTEVVLDDKSKQNGEPQIGSYLRVVDTSTNLGPVVDFCVTDVDEQGVGQMVACCGAFKEGSLRIIRSGLGFMEQSLVHFKTSSTTNNENVDNAYHHRRKRAKTPEEESSVSNPHHDGIRNIWPLYDMATMMSCKEKATLIYALSLRCTSKLIAVEYQENEIYKVRQIQFPGFITKEETICAGITSSNNMIQVTPTRIVLLDSETGEVLWSWQAPSLPKDSPKMSSRIHAASLNQHQLLVAYNGNQLIHFSVQSNLLEIISTKTLVIDNDEEIACITLGPTVKGQLIATFCAVSYWKSTKVSLFSLPEFWPLDSVSLIQPSENVHDNRLLEEPFPLPIAHNLLFLWMGSVLYLFVALGDGSLFVYMLERSEANELAFSFQSSMKKMTLGSAPLQLIPLSLPNSEKEKVKSVVFVLSETPSIIQPSSYGKLSFVHVNIKVHETLVFLHVLF
jgi:DNA damage-binding protein 1